MFFTIRSAHAPGRSGLLRRLLAAVLLWSLSLGACRQQPQTGFLTVYIDDPALYAMLAIYQRETGSGPLSIHLRQGLSMFFQLGGSSQPQLQAPVLPALGSQGWGVRAASQPSTGLFLGSDLQQMEDLGRYLQELPAAYRQSSLDGAAESYLRPLLLYPTLFEISEPVGKQASKQESSDPLLHSQQLSGLYRLLDLPWLRQQLLPAEELQAPAVLLATPGDILRQYLAASPLQVRFSASSFTSNYGQVPAELQSFVRDYRNRLTQLAPAIQTSQTSQTAQGNTSRALAKRLLYQEFQQGASNGYRLIYRGARAKYRENQLPDLYFLGQVADARAALSLQLEKVLWGGIGKELSGTHQQQALDLLAWLHSRQGQFTLQRELAQVDGAVLQGAANGLSLYAEVNLAVWQALELDWPQRFAIRWQLAKPLVRWRPELFQNLSPEQEQLYRQHSADSIIQSFVLPYFFLPELGPPDTGNWALWLEPN